VEGTQVWAAENFADILENPGGYDLPCLWYDPIPVDRCLPLGQPIPWEEYTLTLHPLPGHTRHAVGVEFEVDGQRVLATGDQYQGDDGLIWNYVYQNRYAVGDYTSSAKLYDRVCPDLILPGHWQPLRVTPEYLQKIVADAETLDCLHRDLLPESPDLGAEGFIARIVPYQVTALAGKTIPLEVEIRNPFPQSEEAVIRLVMPQGWQAAPNIQILQIPGICQLLFTVTPPPGLIVRRARLAIDLTIAGQRFGQQAEALITILSGV
jgi:glyoxylase-like metal-dependent hydrolase (beta-lactamase superfamily II)